MPESPAGAHEGAETDGRPSDAGGETLGQRMERLDSLGIADFLNGEYLPRPADLPAEEG